MDFFMQWVWYVLAFLAGSLLAWGIASATIKRTVEDEAVPDRPGSRDTGAEK